jgi:hypothetical protein
MTLQKLRLAFSLTILLSGFVSTVARLVQRFTTPLRKLDSSANNMNPNAAELKYADIRISCPILPKRGQSFVNKDSNQPTAKCAFLPEL